MFYMRLKNCIGTALALLLALGALLFTQSLQVCRFGDIEGKRSFYMRSPSSQALVKEELFLWEFFEVEGESVVFVCEDREKTLREILQRYGASVRFEEQAGGSHSYYCYTEKWSDGIRIGGEFINLHIAFHGDSCAVGTPIIFGGF